MNWRDFLLALVSGVNAGVVVLLCGLVIYLMVKNKDHEQK